MDARFNKLQLTKQIKAIAAFRDQIEISNIDAIDFTVARFKQDDTFFYLDPPYYVKGSKLYRNFYKHDDHCAIRSMLLRHRLEKWIVSYDDVPEIRDIYAPFTPISYSLNYSAGTSSTGSEVIFFSDGMRVPIFPGFIKMVA
ncbi:DNA adenine methylase [Phyllobacterium phragmitis]|uniref:DNA adenine methylase n=1 Tax=Phyllobacterium phragmitis TaxID=2670329 RepID=A0ABQ0GXP2_9HYPH